jgi:D-ribose pyranase
MAMNATLTAALAGIAGVRVRWSGAGTPAAQEPPDMLRTGILNPAVNSLISRVRHTNTLVIADRGFPFWPQIETVDISLVDGIPTVIEVLEAIRANFSVGRIFMAEEFRAVNDEKVRLEFERAAAGVPVIFEPHVDFKKRVPRAVGLIRTGDAVQYANLILESA